jgi:hypothetical protein
MTGPVDAPVERMILQLYFSAVRQAKGPPR